MTRLAWISAFLFSLVHAAPNFYSEADYYATPIDQLQTYPVYVKEPVTGRAVPGRIPQNAVAS